eukprot:1931405-Alexandrium_andersonii.AAC.1
MHAEMHAHMHPHMHPHKHVQNIADWSLRCARCVATSDPLRPTARWQIRNLSKQRSGTHPSGVSGTNVDS